MLAWLGEWLQGIVAIILLAVVVELVLPNSKMLRYSRLVIGLILLLTMLSPVLDIFQKDFQSQLAASFTLWDEQYKKDKIQVPSLDEINRKAEEMRAERAQASGDLTRLGLEEAMKQQLISSGQDNVLGVEVVLGWKEEQSTEQYPYIAGIKVTIKPTDEQAENEHSSNENIIVQDVFIEIGSSNLASDYEILNQPHEQEQQTGFVKISDEQAATIITILTSGWNVNQNQILVQAKA